MKPAKVSSMIFHFWLKIKKALKLLPLLAMAHITTATTPEKIIIDADTGIDDAMAILLAYASPELKVLGITATFGNATLENSVQNALYLTQLAGQTTPVVPGSPVPLVIAPEPPADFVHGANGLGNVEYSTENLPASASLSAAEFIIEQSLLHPGELTLVPIGRLTNIALALKIDPELPKRIKQIVLMGGAVQTPGNVTPVAEANIIGDPHAADIVFTADWEVTLIGLDVTSKVVVGPSDLEELTEANPITGQFLTDISAFYLAFYNSVGVDDGFYVHDPSAILYLLKPDFFETYKAPVRVVTEGIAIGQTIAAFPPHDTRPGNWKNIPKSNIALKVNSAESRRFILNRLASLELHP